MPCHVFCGASLDGYIARPDGAIDWLSGGGQDEDHGYDAFIAGIDALVMGRNTFDLVLSFPSWPYTKPVFVVTHRALPPLPDSHRGAVVQAISGTPKEMVAKLAARGHASLYIDGGNVITQFLEAGLVDTVTVTTVPVLIGEGIRLFGRRAGGPGKDTKLRLVRTRSWPTGLVQSVYAKAGLRDRGEA